MLTEVGLVIPSLQSFIHLSNRIPCYSCKNIRKQFLRFSEHAYMLISICCCPSFMEGITANVDPASHLVQVNVVDDTAESQDERNNTEKGMLV